MPFCHAFRSTLNTWMLAGLCVGFIHTPLRAQTGGNPHTVTLTPKQVASLGIQTRAVAPASDTGRAILQGKVAYPASLLRVISAPVAALVEQVLVAKGDDVKSGQALVSLNAPQIVEWQREYQQATLQLKLAQQTADRDQALLAEGLIPAARAQTSASQLQLAQGTTRERAQLLQTAGVKPSNQLSGRAMLNAPGRGTVVDMLVQPGQRVDAGAPVLKFASAGALAIELQAPPDVARKLSKGDMVRIQGCEVPAKLVSINTELDPGSQTVSARALWTQVNDCALPQQRVQAEVIFSSPTRSGTPASLLVPSGSVLRHDGQDIVFIQRGNHFHAIAVSVISQQAAQGQQSAQTQISPAVTASIKSGDQVVTQGTVALKGAMQGLGAQ